MRAFAGAFLFVFFFFAFSAQAQSTRRTMRNEAADFRLSFYGGAFFPSGSYEESGYPEFNYETGFGGGVDFSCFFNKNFGIGAFLDINYFPSEEKVISGNKYDITATSIIFGISGTGRVSLTDNFWLLLAAKLGAASNSLKAEASSGGSAETSGTTLAASLEAGGLYTINRWDFGIILKYTMNEQEVEGAGNSNLGGLSALLAAGYNF
jgi:hypothetical protein